MPPLTGFGMDWNGWSQAYQSAGGCNFPPMAQLDPWTPSFASLLVTFDHAVAAANRQDATTAQQTMQAYFRSILAALQNMRANTAGQCQRLVDDGVYRLFKIEAAMANVLQDPSW